MKSAARISSVNSLDIHFHALKPGFKRHWDNNGLQLNHYRIQSKEYFEKVKMVRGDVSSGRWEHVRTWDYFEEHDKSDSDVVDMELCSILGCCPS